MTKKDRIALRSRRTLRQRVAVGIAATVWSSLRATAAIIIAAAVSAPAASTAVAQSWPDRPIRFIVGYPPGGGADLVARLFAEHLPKRLGQPVVVENKPGGGGRIAATSAMRAEPDGYTLLVAAISEISIAPATVKDLPYDPDKDFRAVALLAKWPHILVASPQFPPNDIAALVAHVKANPGRVSYSSFGANTLNHINGERFKATLGIDVQHIPYKGSGPSLTDVMAGQVQYTFDSPATTLNLIRSGKLKAIGVAAPQRIAAASDIPTLGEVGLPGFFIRSWIGLLAPAGTSTAVVDRLNRDTIDVLDMPEVQEILTKANTEPGGGTPEEFAKIISEEIADYKRVATRAGIDPQ